MNVKDLHALSDMCGEIYFGAENDDTIEAERYRVGFRDGFVYGLLHAAEVAYKTGGPPGSIEMNNLISSAIRAEAEKVGE